MSFLEPSYLVSLKAMVGETAVNTSELYWNHTTHAVPRSIPKRYVYARHGTQTYTLAHPIMKGCEFSLWRGTYLNEYGQEEIHPLGGLTGYKTQGYEGILGAESSTYKIDFPLYQNKASVMLMRARDINLTAKFTKSDSSHTIGFNPEGGTVKGAKYYIAEDAGFKLDVNTIKPVRAGYTFKGWCTDKTKPDATLVTGSGSGTNIYGTTADNNHTELYAVWSAGSPDTTPTPAPSGEIWDRLYGDNAYGTMAAVAQKGWTTSDTVVVATFSGYWDALAASSLAGLYHAPILLTDIDSLNPVTQQQIVRLKAKKAVIVGGKDVVTDKVKKKIESLGLSVERVAGDNAQLTALEVAKALGAQVSKTCIVATSDGYWDALAASPYSYKEKAPIYLTQPDGTLHPDVAKAIKAGGYERAVIVGGTVVVAPSMEKTLANLGIGTVVRKSGGIAIETSRDFASWAIGNGMSANYMAVATVNDFYDALTGGPLCGLHNGVLVLASNENTSNTVIPAKYKSNIAHAYLLGGPAALGDSVLDAFRAATRASASLRSI